MIGCYACEAACSWIRFTFSPFSSIQITSTLVIPNQAFYIEGHSVLHVRLIFFFFLSVLLYKDLFSQYCSRLLYLVFVKDIASDLSTGKSGPAV